MNKLPLHDYYLEKGAEFVESNGWLQPAGFDSCENEYESASSGVCVYDLSGRGKLRLSGRECFKFMQGMLSNDVVKLESGRGVHATMLTVKGRMIADLYLYKDSQQAFIDLEQGLNVPITEMLLKYRLSYKANIEDVTDKYIQLCYMGPRSTEYLSNALNYDLSGLGHLEFNTVVFKGTEIKVVKVKRSLYDSFDIYVPAESAVIIKEHLLCSSDDIKPSLIGLKTFETLRVEAGIPKYGVDMDENTIPIEAELWDALNFEKGCYIGQEVIARIKWRGHVNRHLVGIELDSETPANPKDKIMIGEKEIGFITSSVYSYQKNMPICLGYIRREYKEPETVVFIASDDKKIRGRVFNFNN